MACKDDWYDEKDARNSALEKRGKKFDIWKWEIVDTVDCINSFLKEINMVFPEELKPYLEVAQQYMPDPSAIKWNESPAKTGENFSSDIFMDQLEKRFEWYTQLAKKLEISLCSMRTWLMQHYLPLDKKIPDSLVLQIERERRLHALHRNTEMNEELTKLKSGIDGNNYHIKQLEASITQFTKLSDEALDERIQKCKTSIEELKIKISESEQRIKKIESIPDYVRMINRNE